MNDKLTLAVFDLDGTVLDTLADLAGSVNFALAAGGFPQRTQKEIRSFLGNGVKNLICRSLPAKTDAAAERVLADFKAHYALHCTDMTCPYKGIPELLVSLRAAGIRTAVVSNKTDDAVQKLAKKFFPGLFDYVAGEKEGVARKPAPDGVYAALAALGVKRENALYIGDSEVDVQTAKNAGLPCIAVSWGFRDEDVLWANGAVCVVNTVRELEEKIHSTFNRL